MQSTGAWNSTRARRLSVKRVSNAGSEIKWARWEMSEGKKNPHHSAFIVVKGPLQLQFILMMKSCFVSIHLTDVQLFYHLAPQKGPTFCTAAASSVYFPDALCELTARSFLYMGAPNPWDLFKGHRASRSSLNPSVCKASHGIHWGNFGTSGWCESASDSTANLHSSVAEHQSKFPGRRPRCSFVSGDREIRKGVIPPRLEDLLGVAGVEMWANILPGETDSSGEAAGQHQIK